MYFRTVPQRTQSGEERKYDQLVQSVRTDKGPRQKMLVNLGRLDTEEAPKLLEVLAVAIIELIDRLHLLDLTKDVQGEETQELGMQLVFKKLDEKIGLRNILNKAFVHHKTDFDISDALMNLIANRISKPVSKNAMSDWQATQHEMIDYQTHQYYRAMDYLGDHQEVIEEEIYQSMRALSTANKSDVSIALFDTTSVMYFGDA